MTTRRALSTLVLTLGALFVLLVVALFTAVALAGKSRAHPDRPAVGVVEIRGAIEDSRTFVEQLQALVEDPDIKALVIRIDSPGGAVGPSQEMRAEIIRARGKKKIVASLGTVAASGGFYAALGADKIVSNPGTLTASIGVIMQHPVVPELLKQAHVDMQTYKSGALKDSGSPFRLPNTEDRTYLQGVTDEVAAQFVDAVVESRNLSRDRVLAVADGRVVTGAHARELGLVDELGTLQDAARLALKLADVPGEPELVYPPKDSAFLRDLLGHTAQSFAQGLTQALVRLKVVQGGPVLPEALWQGTPNL